MGLAPEAAEAEELHYQYVPLEPPAGFMFFDPVAIDDSGRVFGNAYNDDFILHVAFFEGGETRVLPAGGQLATTANASGTVGGGVVIDIDNFFTQAALFHGTKTELIPLAAGKISSVVVALNDPGTALVSSLDDMFEESFELYENGQTIPLDFGPKVTSPFILDLDNQGLISGNTQRLPPTRFRGFRFDTHTGQATLLGPIEGDSHSLALDINNRGTVVGYSFFNLGLERVGVWDEAGLFMPYFVEGTPEFPTISNKLLINDNNLIVITQTLTADDTSYIVPEPGVRLNLADLTDDLPAPDALSFIAALNNHADMVGFGSVGNFLLKRTTN